jgi:hypothetical protein
LVLAGVPRVQCCAAGNGNFIEPISGVSMCAAKADGQSFS